MDIDGFSFENYNIIINEKQSAQSDMKFMENEYLKLTVSDEGSLNLFDKKNGKEYRNILIFEDIKDIGDSYVHIPVKGDIPEKYQPPKITKKSNSPLQSSMNLSYKEGIELSLNLKKGERHIGVACKINNTKRNHLIRAVINTGITSDEVYSSSVFDVVCRKYDNYNNKINNATQPSSGLVYIKDGSHGFAVFTKGLYEYEHIDRDKISISLLRSTEWIQVDAGDPRVWKCPDNLMIGETDVSFALYPFGRDEKSLLAYEKTVNNPPLYYTDSVEIKKMFSGRPAVQDSELQEIFYPIDKYASIKLPVSKTVISVHSEVCVSALKLAENESGIILRIYNPYETAEGIINSKYEISSVDMSEISEDKFINQIQSKKVKTYKLKLNE